MRRINRRSLEQATLKKLARRTKQITDLASHEERAQKAKDLWKAKLVCFERDVELRLLEMAGAGGLCMYCEGNEGSSIDHFWPKADYPERSFVWENYLWACSVCNSNLKRDAFPLGAGNAPMLIDPTAEDPQALLRLQPSTGRFITREARGHKTIEVFDLNHDKKLRPRDLAQARSDTWFKLCEMIVAYAAYKEAGRLGEVQRTRRVIRSEPFPTVLTWMLNLSRLGTADSLFIEGQSKDCLRVLRDERYQEIYRWSDEPVQP
jgi:uncharacterized protein (TIGR02646 family)